MCGYRHQYSSSPEHPPRFERLLTGGWTTIDLPSSNPVNASTGVWILWFGWFAFNVSSALVTNGHASIGRVAVATTVCSATSTLASVYLSHGLQLFARHRDAKAGVRAPRYSMWQLDDVLNGLLAGSVASTSGCAVVPVWSMLVIGLVAAFVMHGGVHLLLWLKIDDPVQAVPVHMFCGAWSVLAAALFADRALLIEVYGLEFGGANWGLFMGGGGRLLLCAFIGVLVVTAWAVITTGSLFWFMARYDKFRQYDVFFIRSPQGEETGFGQKLQEREQLQVVFPAMTSSQISATSPLTGSLSPIAPQMPESLGADTAVTEAAAAAAADATWFKSMKGRRHGARNVRTPRKSPGFVWRTALTQRGRSHSGDSGTTTRDDGDFAQALDGNNEDDENDGDDDDDSNAGRGDDIRLEFAGSSMPHMPFLGATITAQPQPAVNAVPIAAAAAAATAAAASAHDSNGTTPGQDKHE